MGALQSLSCCIANQMPPPPQCLSWNEQWIDPNPFKNETVNRLRLVFAWLGAVIVVLSLKKAVFFSSFIIEPNGAHLCLHLACLGGPIFCILVCALSASGVIFTALIECERNGMVGKLHLYVCIFWITTRVICLSIKDIRWKSDTVLPFCVQQASWKKQPKWPRVNPLLEYHKKTLTRFWQNLLILQRPAKNLGVW